MKSSYMTRAMQSRDRRFAVILKKLGHVPHVSGQEADTSKDDLTALRAEYEAVIGKRPFHGWDAGTLATKIAEAKED